MMVTERSRGRTGSMLSPRLALKSQSKFHHAMNWNPGISNFVFLSVTENIPVWDLKGPKEILFRKIELSSDKHHHEFMIMRRETDLRFCICMD